MVPDITSASAFIIPRSKSQCIFLGTKGTAPVSSDAFNLMCSRIDLYKVSFFPEHKAVAKTKACNLVKKMIYFYKKFD